MTDQQETKEVKDKEENRVPSSSITFDAETFMHFLDQTDWSDGEKAEYLALIWEIVCEFVALGFNVHPIQQAQKACGKSGDLFSPPASGSLAVIDLSHGELMKEFLNLSGADTASGEEGVTDE